MMHRKNALFSISVLLFLGGYSGGAAAGWCVPDSVHPEEGLTIMEYGIGNTAYADPNNPAFQDGNSGIYLKVKTKNGTKKSYIIDPAMNLNDPQGAAFVSTIKSAFLTGALVKINGTTNACSTINSIAVMAEPNPY